MPKQARIVLVGGGTGGHFYPLISISEALQQLDPVPELYYMGPSPYDADVLAVHQISYIYCPAGKTRRYASMRNIVDMVKTVFGICIAIFKLYVLYPDVIVSKGGYTSVPVVVAAGFLKIPIIVHESDSVLGRANKIAARFARFVAVSYPTLTSSFPPDKTVYTGIPVRTELLKSAVPNAREQIGISTALPVLLILGGSQGAERVNELILDSLDELLPHYEIIHQTGEALFEKTVLAAKNLIKDTDLLTHYHPTGFLSQDVLHLALSASDLVISRAGSGTIHEIALHEKPSILIPIPEEISHDQRTNAYTYAKSGGAVVMEEANLKDGLLLPEIERIMHDSSVYGSLVHGAKVFAKRDGAEEMVRLITHIVKEHY